MAFRRRASGFRSRPNISNSDNSTYSKGSRFFLGQIGQRKRLAALMLLLTIGYSGMVALTPLFLGGIVDALSGGDPFDNPPTFSLFGIEAPQWMFYFGGFVLASLGQYCFSLIKDRLEALIGTRIKQFYLFTRFSHILRLPYHYLKDKKKGELIGVTEEFASGFDRALNDVLSLLEVVVRTAIYVILIAVVISYINGAVYLVGLAIAFAISLRVARTYRRVVGERVDEVSATKGRSYDVINNYDVVKGFNKELYEANALSRIYDKLRSFELRENATYLRYNAYNLFILQAFIFLNFGVGLWLLSRGDITIGNLVTLNIYSAFIFGLIVGGADRYINFTGFLFGVGKSEEIYELPEERYSGPDLRTTPAFTAEIQFRNVWFAYPDGDDDVLRDVSFTISPGERVAITGSSGVGKTTMVNLIMGYYFPTKGEILINGISTKELDRNFLRSNISLVSQEVALFNDTIGNNIRYGAIEEPSHEQLVASCEKAEIHDFIAGLPNRYDQVVGERGIKLSGGQKQRVGIARAFIRNAQFVVLDEPTSSLDSITEEKIQRAFDSLLGNQTSLVIAHRLSTVKAADKILIFKEGRLIAEGTHDNLVATNSEYRTLYELQVSK